MVRSYRQEFPLLAGDDSFSYLDNGATTQKPQCVIDAVSQYYQNENANPLRGLYDLSARATECYESSRKAAAGFFHAESPSEIIFTRNTTESLNLAAFSLSAMVLKPEDEILLTVMEHHSNLVPWQMAANRTGARLVYLYPDQQGQISQEQFLEKLSARTKIAALTHVSNVLGSKLPLKKFAAAAHEAGAVVIGDGAQAAAHLPVDVTDLDLDFYACSGHKMYGPMGIGILYGKKKLLEEMPPFLTGGEMIDQVHEQSVTFAGLPEKFEAGTVNVGGAKGLQAAIDYMTEIGFPTIQEREEQLVCYAMEALHKLPYVTIYGSQEPEGHTGVIAFNIDGVHPHDTASILSAGKVAVRAGHHCAQPLMEYLGIGSCCRASFAIYNEKKDIDCMVEQIKHVRRLFYGA